MCLKAAMRKSHKILVISLALFSASAFAEFTGSWHIEYPQNKTNTTTADEFNIFLLQSGGVICGFHYGTARGKAKVDYGWAYTTKPTVLGALRSLSVAEVTLHSSHTSTPVNALLTLNGNKLTWLVNTPNSELPPTIPKSATLVLTKSKGHELRELENCSVKDA